MNYSLRFLIPAGLVGIVLGIILSIDSSNNSTFTGYIVAKEYTPAHMSNTGTYTISYAVIIPKPTPPHHVPARWVWFVANRNRVIEKQISEQMFNTQKCGDKVTVKR